MARLNRHLRIYVGAATEDVRDLQRQAIEVVLDMGHIPVVLDGLDADNDRDWILVERAIAASHVYLGVIGKSYPEASPPEGTTAFEREYRTAEKNGLRLVAMVPDADAIPTALRGTPDEKRLSRFHDNIRVHAHYWLPDNQFKYHVLRALAEILSEPTPTSLVTIPQSSTFDLLASASDNEFVLDTVAQLQSFRELYDRCSYHRPEKRALALFLREQYIDSIVNNHVSLFFESGATIAHVARQLAEALAGFVRIEKGGIPNIQISTNNVLAYLQFWLISRVPCTTFP